MVKTAPQDKRECSADTDKCCYHYLFWVAIVQYDMQLNRSTYEVLQFLVSH